MCAKSEPWCELLQTLRYVDTMEFDTRASLKPSRIEFAGSLGDTLAARLDLPPSYPRAFALFAHCFTCSKDILAASRISRELSKRGFGVLRFDFTGLGHSDGEFANTNFSSNIEDLVLAANWLRTEHRPPSLLIGHSLGGAAVLAAAKSIPETVAVATIGAPADPTHLRTILGISVATIETAGEAEVVVAGRRFRIRKQFLDDLTDQRQQERIRQLGKSLLVLHSPIDEIVGIEHAMSIFSTANHPKSFISLDGADHLLTNREDATYVARVLAAWASRYLADGRDMIRTPTP